MRNVTQCVSCDRELPRIALQLKGFPVSSTDSTADTIGFADLNLPAPLMEALAAVGYESPSPIQAQTIPALLSGSDLVGQAQTGTGKTAAFALPILAQLDLKKFGPQALVLTPTRELAIQVSEAFQKYASKLRGFHVLPIYGGQGYGPQLSGLRRGAHVVVGTPGRVIDHLQRGTLDLSGLRTLVLDEGDEMLRMGFIDDVEAVLAKAPAERQVALFSATMPTQIRRIAKNHLREPVQITIRAKTTTAENTRQRYLAISHFHKLDALTRILEVEPFDAMIIFARTKIATEELAQKLEARGFAAAPLNGDIPQAQRERTVDRLKKGASIFSSRPTSRRADSTSSASATSSTTTSQSTSNRMFTASGEPDAPDVAAMPSSSSPTASATCCKRSSVPPGSDSSGCIRRPTPTSASNG